MRQAGGRIRHTARYRPCNKQLRGIARRRNAGEQWPTVLCPVQIQRRGRAGGSCREFVFRKLLGLWHFRLAASVCPEKVSRHLGHTSLYWLHSGISGVGSKATASGGSDCGRRWSVTCGAECEGGDAICTLSAVVILAVLRRLQVPPPRILLENERVAVGLEAERGGIASLVDKTTGRNLAAAVAKPMLFQLEFSLADAKSAERW